MKPFKTIDEQIEILKSRGLKIDLDNTKEILFKEGYYNIINGYKDIFLEDEKGEKFKDGTTFSQIYNMYLFDNAVRNIVLNACISIENTIETVLSYEIAKEYGVYEAGYLNRTNYRTGIRRKTPKGNFLELDSVLRNLNHVSSLNEEPYKHYKNKHGHIPPWILFKGINFWTLKTFLNLQKPKVKDAVTSNLLNINLNYITEADKQFLSDIIHIVYKFRNRAAHNGRMYSFNINNSSSAVNSNTIRYYKPFHDQMNITKTIYNKGYGKSDFYTFYYACKQILNPNEKKIFHDGMVSLTDWIRRVYGMNDTNILKLMGIPDELINNKKIEIFK